MRQQPTVLGAEIPARQNITKEVRSSIAGHWAALPDAESQDVVPIPFTEAEAEAILAAQRTHTMLAILGLARSGPAREFLAGSQLFPSTV